ncbi:MAG: hypothetical protein WKF47_06280 [Geodermatophilaceae bacterium]
MQLLVPKGGDSNAAFAGRLQEVDRNSDSLLAALPASGGKVLLQYSAYGFDRIGYPRWLLRALVKWKKSGGGSLVVMLHEIWTFWPLLNKNHLVQQMHRRDLRTLLQHSDAVFTSTASQAQHLRSLLAEAAVQVLPVGSNVVPARDSQNDRASGVAVLFGLLGTRCRTLEAMRSELKRLASAGALSKIVSIGVGDAADQLEQEHAILAELTLGDGFEQRGPLAELEVSEIMLEAQFGISAQDELSISKSGTVMAYAAHGMNIISTHGGVGKSRAATLVHRTRRAAARYHAGGIGRPRKMSPRLAARHCILAVYCRAPRPRAAVAARIIMKSKILIVSPCQGAYGGIEAFVPRARRRRSPRA